MCAGYFGKTTTNYVVMVSISLFVGLSLSVPCPGSTLCCTPLSSCLLEFGPKRLQLAMEAVALGFDSNKRQLL